MDSVSPVPERGDAGTSLVVDLSQLASASLASVGGKAFNLGRLAAADFPVPPGFCLTTVGYRKAAPAEMDVIAARLDEGGLGVAAGLPDEDRNGLSRRGRELMAAAPVPPDVEAALRAVAYRTANGIMHREVSLAVVVQQMVRAGTAGVLFTANPVTGTRTETVIDASPGPGQAVVSGAVNPDHSVVETERKHLNWQRPQSIMSNVSPGLILSLTQQVA